MINHTANVLFFETLSTPLGCMMAIASDAELFLLEFHERKNFDLQLERLKHLTKSTIKQNKSAPICSIEQELKSYFEGKLHEFKTPIRSVGSAFQLKVWNELKNIPYGETRSYLELAKAIGQPNACRAVAGANASNPLAIVVPCHRVINQNGKLGGYAGGLPRKDWLLNMEASTV